MYSLCRPSLIVLLLLLAAPAVFSQTVVGSLEVTGRVTIGKDKVLLKRKRFYLLPGGIGANKGIVERLRAATSTSRDCYYCQLKASPEFTAWLKSRDCESPYCRAVTDDDIAKVPEFQAAYQKGLKQFKGKADIARKWLITNLAPDLRDGFYRRRKALVDTLLAGIKPMQSAMTDSVSVRAVFIDIPLKKNDAAETFLISNLVPVEIGDKSYIWACEVDISSSKKAILSLKVPESGKPVKRCEVVVRDLPVCTTGTCGPK